MDMRVGILLAALGLAMLSSSAFAEKVDENVFPDAWVACNAETDCIVMPGVCGGWDCVNPSARAKLDKINRRMEEVYGCKGAPPSPPRPKPICTPKGCRCEKSLIQKPDGKW